MKKFLVLAALLLGTLTAVGQTNYVQFAPGPAVSCNAVAATGACTAISMPNMNGQWPTEFAWQLIFTGTPSAITVNLEGSIDGTNWFTVDSSTATTSGIKWVVDKPVRLLRCNVSAYTVNSSTATCSFLVTQK